MSPHYCLFFHNIFFFSGKNPCDENNGDCEHLCLYLPYHGKQRCFCKEKFIVNENGKTCEKIKLQGKLSSYITWNNGRVIGGFSTCDGWKGVETHSDYGQTVFVVFFLKPLSETWMNLESNKIWAFRNKIEWSRGNFLSFRYWRRERKQAFGYRDSGRDDTIVYHFAAGHYSIGLSCLEETLFKTG